jgi:methionine synthase I (cobalamin-dependent)
MEIVRMTLAAALGLTALRACTSVRSADAGSVTHRAPFVADKVAFFMTAQQVGARFYEIALLPAADAFSVANAQQVYRSLQEKVAARGANAILFDSMYEQTRPRAAYALIGTPADRAGKAVAIFVDDTTSRSKPHVAN